MHQSILITGVAGSGKSAVCKELNKRGYKAFNIEEIEGLFCVVDKKTGKVIKNADKQNLELVKQTDWICHKEKIEKLVSENKNGIVYYCGTASNLEDLFFLFDKVFLLKIEKEVLQHRLRTRKSNDFGRNSKVQEWLCSILKSCDNYMVAKGAIIIDGSNEISIVADEIIAKSI